MLSGETAKGDYPLHCIRTMAAISREAEACFNNEKFFEDLLAAVSSLPISSHGGPLGPRQTNNFCKQYCDKKIKRYCKKKDIFPAKFFSPCELKIYFWEHFCTNV
jgi:hypothetical protein